MNIAFYTEQEITPYTGGIGRVTSILTEYFRHHFGWRVYSLYANRVSYDKVTVDGACQGRLHDRWGIRRGIRMNVQQAARFLQAHQVDVVIVQTSTDVPGRLRRALQQIGYDAKVITCLHFTPGKDIFLNHLSDLKGVSPFSKQGLKIVLKSVLSVLYNPLITHLTRKCYRRAYQYSDGVYLLSKSYQEDFCAFSGVHDRQKLHTMPNPLSFNVNVPASVLEHKKPVVLVVGRMSEYEKRISIILSVWQRFEQAYPESEWQLKIVGGGTSLADYKKQKAVLGLKKCCFEGVQDPVPYYRESKIFLMTSAFEGFPMTLVEAAQFGCVPVVMNAFSSLPEIVTDQHNGVVVENNDEAQFLRAMEHLMANGDYWHQLAANALHDCQRFSQKTICTQWKKNLEELVK